MEFSALEDVREGYANIWEAWSLVTQASTILMQMILKSLLVTHVGALLDQDKRVSLSAMSVSTIWIIRDLEH